jgi:hypothetical protein
VQEYVNAEAIRDVARTLIDRQPPIAPPGQEVFLDPTEWPMEIRALAPRAVEVAPDLVAIRFGKLATTFVEPRNLYVAVSCRTLPADDDGHTL